jgi:UDP-glucose 4-epimerase
MEQRMATSPAAAPRPVLIVGGAGFIGKALIDELLAAGEPVVVYDDFSSGTRLPSRSGLTLIEGDLRDREHVFQVVREHRPRAVYHLAAFAYIPYCDEHPIEATQVHVLGTQILFEACREVGIDRMIMASTAAVYGVSDQPHRESDARDPQEFYGMTKVVGELQLAMFQKTSGISCVATRFFNVYGRGETNPHVIPEIFRQLRETGKLKLGNITPVRDLIHVTDIGRALKMCLDAPLPPYEVFNIGTGTVYSVADVVAELESILQHAIVVEQDPARMRKVDRHCLQADITHIKTALGWEPRVGLREGLRDLAIDLLGADAVPAIPAHEPAGGA